MQDMADITLSARDALGDQIIARLRRRKLPQMVDWFDPRLLARSASDDGLGTLGQYADQRLMQAASDRATRRNLVPRYDYSGTDNASDA